MKVQNLTKTVLVALMIASPLVSAEAQYPAADFQPEIIKQDADLIAKHAKASSASSSTSSAPSNSASNDSSSNSASASFEASAAPKQEEPLNLTYILIGVALAAGAFLLTRNKGTTAGTEASGGFAPAPAVSNHGASGVENYVNNLSQAPAKLETGVQRYVSAMPQSAPQAKTGVAKYISSLPATEAKSGAAAAPQAAKGTTGVDKYVSAMSGAAHPQAAAETGVAKYLKNQGLAA